MARAMDILLHENFYTECIPNVLYIIYIPQIVYLHEVGVNPLTPTHLKKELRLSSFVAGNMTGLSQLSKLMAILGDLE